ncbi:hypothetical protein HanRHA438_Chr15g0733721 [Helianthus annuus]|uniref:Uncharacterized protein n=1 Tax=Helianthus annuus TaxID=4232 RepID=A0A9K3E4N4_HELAN|nr:hypothetical protein HanXRQr2_Chr15g0721131 [Helianthus annuus]KAJ0453255.1 hypothetical protein HanHA300_Chr15g0588301 [Helianthus annuus]KAJ0475170.1 hypothetical protein HanHA89_Chr15g0638101 [Helianthus annuus]KAJ0650726.1 hypothetical protein HanLR1_Chr15g0599021 [Helianthus annuus]KAJ0654479.1 hypothetical protein HanOQP8_Chr15g0595451 [Helianthus annuus]
MNPATAVVVYSGIRRRIRRQRWCLGLGRSVEMWWWRWLRRCGGGGGGGDVVVVVVEVVAGMQRRWRVLCFEREKR